MWQDEIEALWPPCVDLFEDLALGTDDVDELVLLGGSVQVPAVEQLIEGLFRRAPLRPERWRTLAAIGAARIAGRAGRGDELVQSVMPHSIGVKVRGGGVRPLGSQRGIRRGESAARRGHRTNRHHRTHGDHRANRHHRTHGDNRADSSRTCGVARVSRGGRAGAV